MTGARIGVGREGLLRSSPGGELPSFGLGSLGLGSLGSRAGLWMSSKERRGLLEEWREATAVGSGRAAPENLRSSARAAADSPGLRRGGTSRRSEGSRGDPKAASGEWRLDDLCWSAVNARDGLVVDRSLEPGPLESSCSVWPRLRANGSVLDGE